jgi:hypothetical protein
LLVKNCRLRPEIKTGELSLRPASKVRSLALPGRPGDGSNPVLRKETQMSPTPSFRIARLALCILSPLIAVSEAEAAALTRSASGANAGAIQTTVDQFRADLGTLNANGAGSFLTGRREINWDGVPDSLAAPNNLPADFFNVNSPRGVLLSTPGTGLRVSADSANSTSTPTQFGDIDPAYPASFEPFSTERLFTAIGSNIVDVTFFVPGTTIPASVSGFGVVFSDVDSVNTTSIIFFDSAGNSLGTFFAPNIAGSQTFSFLGVSFNAGERVARVRITCGNQVLAAGNNNTDLVVMDDFIYGEPVPYPDAIAVSAANNTLVRFNTRTPDTVVGSYGLTGLNAGENLVGLDFRIATGQLYGLASDNSGAPRLLLVPLTGGALTQVGPSLSSLSGTDFGFDFNPTVDRLRITNDVDQNASVDPANGAVTLQTPLNPGNPTVVGSAYTNSIPGETTTQLFGIDSAANTLVLQNPAASGTLTTRGPLGVDTSGLVGFDIAGYTNTGYAILTISNTSRLFTIDLDDGNATQIGTDIGAGITVRGMALVPQAPTNVTALNTNLLAVGVSNNLIKFNSDSPASVTTISITGLGAGETIHAIDVRPANQGVYALGITEGPGTNDAVGRLYVINQSSGAATLVGAGPISTTLADNASYGFDFNPATDRIRIVNSADESLRVNPDNGVLVQFDTDLNNQAGNEIVGAVAYDRNDLDPTTGTTLYAINTSTNNLEIVGAIDGAPPNSPNGGVLNIVGPLGTTLFNSIGGFDVAPSGQAFAALRAGSFYSLYSIDLTSGAAIPRGLIQNGALTIRGLAVAPEPCAITCPANITMSNNPNQCGAVVTYPTPTTMGVCGPVNMSKPSGSFFPKGTTTVTATTANTASCSFNVTVNDVQPPSITCPPNITQPADPGQQGAVVTYALAGASDNCPGLTTQFSPASGSFFPVGTTTVDSRATDSSGNFSTCFFSVTITAPPPTPTPTPPTQLVNISTRLPVGAGDDALIAGFIVVGTQPKKVIIRGIGPSLGRGDQLGNPTLELFTGQTSLGTNDDWMDSTPADKQAIIDSTVAPSNSLEPAIVRTLPASTNGTAYTAVLRGVNNSVGIGVIEVYDLDRSVDSKLANISTRGLVQTGDKALFAGMIVLGPSTQKVIIRAIGPSLTVAGKMLDPMLELRDANGTVLRANDNWRIGGQEQEIIDSTVAPTDNAEAALIHILPGSTSGASYTAIVSGAGGEQGIAVVEVYALQ